MHRVTSIIFRYLCFSLSLEYSYESKRRCTLKTLMTCEQTINKSFFYLSDLLKQQLDNVYQVNLIVNGPMPRISVKKKKENKNMVIIFL